MAKTCAKLLQSPFCSILEDLHLNKPEDPVLSGPQAAPLPSPFTEVASQFRILELKEGAALPTLKKGMYILLEGELECRTHWNKEAGFSFS